jgi:hypothetical protein
MTKLIGTLVLSGTLVLLPSKARPQDGDWADSSESAAVVAAEAPSPSTLAPSELPPAPPSESPPAPIAQPQAQSALPPGQWVYTQQYGWIWMPYADQYTYAPPDGYGEPYAYVYSPAYACWSWLAAPWVWGFGPWPTFGLIGPARFAWYGHGWWRDPARWHYAPSGGGFYGSRAAPFYRGGTRYGGARPAPYRGGTGYRGGGWRPAPSHTGGSAFFGGGRGGGFAPQHVGFSGGRSGFGSAVAHSGGHGGMAGFAGHGGSGGHVSGGRGGGHGGRR